VTAIAAFITAAPTNSAATERAGYGWLDMRQR
jgi:hypothetical protein